MAGKLPHKRYFTGNKSRPIALWEIFVKGFYSAPGCQRGSSLGKGSSRVVNCFCVLSTRGRPTAWWLVLHFLCSQTGGIWEPLVLWGFRPLPCKRSSSPAPCAAEKWRVYRFSSDTCESPSGLWGCFLLSLLRRQVWFHSTSPRDSHLASKFPVFSSSLFINI